MGKFDLHWPMAFVFSVALVVTGALVYTGKLPPVSLTAFFAWLLPSPVIPKESEPEPKP